MTNIKCLSLNFRGNNCTPLKTGAALRDLVVNHLTKIRKLIINILEFEFDKNFFSKIPNCLHTPFLKLNLDEVDINCSGNKITGNG